MLLCLCRGAAGVATNISEGTVVHARFLGQAHDALGDDVFLNLVGSASDGNGRSRDQNFRDDAVHGAVGAGQQGIVAADGGMHSGGEAGNVLAASLPKEPSGPWAFLPLPQPARSPVIWPFRHHVQARDVLTLCRIIDGAGFHRRCRTKSTRPARWGYGYGLVGDGELFFEIFKNFALTAFAPRRPGSVKDRRSFAKVVMAHFQPPPASPPDHHDNHRVGHKDFVERRVTVHCAS